MLTLSVSPFLALFLSLTHCVLFSLQGKRKKRKRDNKIDSTPEGEDRYTHSHSFFYLALFVSNLAFSSLLCDMQLMKSSASTGRYVCGLRGRSHRIRFCFLSALVFLNSSLPHHIRLDVYSASCAKSPNFLNLLTCIPGDVLFIFLYFMNQGQDMNVECVHSMKDVHKNTLIFIARRSPVLTPPQTASDSHSSLFIVAIPTTNDFHSNTVMSADAHTTPFPCCDR